MNDSVMELLIMINACKGGSSKSVTGELHLRPKRQQVACYMTRFILTTISAVIPYFPYSRQSKKKAHRSAITARMVANLIAVAGVDHVITIDLHASQMQGFFKCPVDNLVAEPLLAKWIRHNVKDWQNAVVVSKNPGGTKRVTSLADALKLSFGIITTDRRKHHMPGSMYNSVMLDPSYSSTQDHKLAESHLDLGEPAAPIEHDYAPHADHVKPSEYLDGAPDGFPRRPGKPRATTAVLPTVNRLVNGASHHHPPSPLAKSTRPGSSGDNDSRRSSLAAADAQPASPPRLTRGHTAIGATNQAGDQTEDEEDDEFTDERARNVITGRLIHGHLVDDDYPSPSLTAMTSSIPNLHKDGSDDGHGSPPEHMLNSFMSEKSAYRAHGIGGSGDATASDDEEEEALKDPELETTITLVGNVRNRPVLIVDDIFDKAGSWIAAAETVVKRGGATHVYCMATHGLFGDDALQELEACAEIDRVIVTNSFPISEDKKAGIHKLTVLDVSHLLSEAIRRNAHGESISQLFMHLD